MSVYFSTMWPMVNHHVDSNFFALLSVVCMVLWQDTRKSSSSGCRRRSGWSDNLHLAAEGNAATVCFPAMALDPATWRPDLRHLSLALVAAGYVAVVGPTLLYFWSRGALWDLIYMNFVWPSQNYGSLNAIPYATVLS